MNDRLKLLCLLAHPDDETLGVGGTLAKYATEGVETYVVSATRGERGRYGDAAESPGLDVVGKTREAELLAAAKELSIKEVSFLDYIDGDLDKADPKEAIAKIVSHVRRIRPQVVITFDQYGGYGHPDHIAISQFATAAMVSSADSEFKISGKDSQPHVVSKLYYMAWGKGKWDAYIETFKELKTTIDGAVRRLSPWPDWALTTCLDTEKYWREVWAAALCHETQISIYRKLGELSERSQKALWGSQEFYRVFSTVNGGRKKESDIFEGLR